MIEVWRWYGVTQQRKLHLKKYQKRSKTVLFRYLAQAPYRETKNMFSLFSHTTFTASWCSDPKLSEARYKLFFSFISNLLGGEKFKAKYSSEW